MSIRNIVVGVAVGAGAIAGAVSVVAHEKGIYDMRKGRRPELEKSPLAWYPACAGKLKPHFAERTGDMNMKIVVD